MLNALIFQTIFKIMGFLTKLDPVAYESSMPSENGRLCYSRL